MNIEQYNEIKTVEKIFKKWNDKFAFHATLFGRKDTEKIVLEVNDLLIPSKELLKEEVNREVFSYNKWIKEKIKFQQLYATQTDEVLRVIKESNYQELNIIDNVSNVELFPCPDILRITGLIEKYAKKGNTLKDFFVNMNDTYPLYAEYIRKSPVSGKCGEQSRFLNLDYMLIEEGHLGDDMYSISSEKVGEVYKLFQRADLYYKELTDFIKRFKKIGETLLSETATVYGIHKNKSVYKKVLKKYQEQ